MKTRLTTKAMDLRWFLFLSPLLLFWLILIFRLPSSLSRYFHVFSPILFLVVIACYYGAFSSRGIAGVVLPLALTMTLVALALSYMWTSGFSDNFVIGGLLPYKDAKNYYVGANLLLNGLPMINAGQATERPLFPGLLASLLMLTGRNLQWSIGIIVQLAGLSLFVSARQIRNSFGAPAGSLFAALLYYYIQPFIGYSLSELLGFLAGCWGFTMLLRASDSLKKRDLLLGATVLLVAISARAGAFLIFPMLAIWVGWAFRGDKRFSWKAAAAALVLIVLLYVAINSIYARLLGIPSGAAFANFSYALYGQVHGGTGWHSAIEELNTRDPAVVYRVAFDFFLEHPLSLLIGFAKAYRDFILLGDGGIFPFVEEGRQSLLTVILWLGMLGLLVRGTVQLFKGVRFNTDSLLLAGLVGILLSIPFLPPIDGGSRFHAGSMAFFFAPVIIGLRGVSKTGPLPIQSDGNAVPTDLIVSRYFPLLILTVVLILPPLIRFLNGKPADPGIECPQGQQPFLIDSLPGSNIDLAIDRSTGCGYLPDVCLDDLETNNREIISDDFYQFLISSVKKGGTTIRLIPAIDLIQNRFHYFYLPLDAFPDPAIGGHITGCAMEIKTKDQNIFQVKSLFPNTFQLPSP